VYEFTPGPAATREVRSRGGGINADVPDICLLNEEAKEGSCSATGEAQVQDLTDARQRTTNLQSQPRSGAAVQTSRNLDIGTRDKDWGPFDWAVYPEFDVYRLLTTPVSNLASLMQKMSSLLAPDTDNCHCSSRPKTLLFENCILVPRFTYVRTVMQPPVLHTVVLSVSRQLHQANVL
jgi:hypothetical protein